MEIYTIGHSNHSWPKFLSLLNKYNITVIGDVRSCPYSKHFPHFNYPVMKNECDRSISRITYCFWGMGLGGRPTEMCHDDRGNIDYHSYVDRENFRVHIGLLCWWAESYTVALMCSERFPATCHRSFLISRYLLEQRGVNTKHILCDGEIVTQQSISSGARSLQRTPIDPPQLSLFANHTGDK
jgi:uncharacterized protein (DUF488 family)